MTAPGTETPPAMPRWVKVMAVLALVAIAAVVAVLLLGGHTSPVQHF